MSLVAKMGLNGRSRSRSELGSARSRMGTPWYNNRRDIGDVTELVHHLSVPQIPNKHDAVERRNKPRENKGIERALLLENKRTARIEKKGTEK